MQNSLTRQIKAEKGPTAHHHLVSELHPFNLPGRKKKFSLRVADYTGLAADYPPA